ncbi:MAG: glycosyltransferase [Chloroflexi bacterium]|nr:glycosyltransferase [Chloroflexota bacterium]
MHLLMMTQIIDMDDPILGFTHEWVNTLAQQVSHLHVICRIHGRYQLAKNVTLHPFSRPNEPDSPIRRHLFFHRSLLRLIFRHQIDAVFVHMIPKWVGMCWPYTFLQRIPLSLWYTHSAISPALQRAHQLADHIFTASLDSYPLAGSHIHPIGHGIDTNLFKPMKWKKENGRFQIIMPGRITETKQPHLLIDAIDTLPPSQKTSVRCQIIGKTSSKADQLYLARINQQIENKGLSSIVTVTGGVPYSQMAAHYQNADLVINLSKTNSLDKTVLEGMACGVPVLTSNPACHTFLGEIDTNLVLKHGDVNGLSKQISYVLNLATSEKQILGQALRQEIIQNHNLNQLMARLTSLMR